MQIHGSYPGITRLTQRLLLAMLCLIAAGAAHATPALFDRYTDGEQTGQIFAEKCCYLDLPEDRRMRELRRQRLGSCSAAGAPVGVFRREQGKLWLTALAECGGEIPLETHYQGLQGPVVATWLSGTFKAYVGHCYTTAAQHKYAVTQVLVIEQGVVKSVNEIHNDISDCKR